MHTIESWVNLFKSRNATDPLVNIALAVKATDSITDDLRTAEKKGNAAFVSFVEKRLKSNEIDYLYAPLPKSNLQTFGNLVKSRTVKSTATAVVVMADRGVFARMVVISASSRIRFLPVQAQPTAARSSRRAFVTPRGRARSSHWAIFILNNIAITNNSTFPKIKLHYSISYCNKTKSYNLI